MFLGSSTVLGRRLLTGILKHMVPSSSGLGTLSKNNKVLLFLSASSSEYLIERGNWKERSEIRYRRGVLVLKHMVPSSSGLGHGPLKAVTRVRLSLGSPIQKPPLTEGVFVLCNPRRRTSRVRAGAKRKQAYAVARKMVLDLLQNGSGSVLKSRFRLSFKRWGLPVGL